MSEAEPSNPCCVPFGFDSQEKAILFRGCLTSRLVRRVWRLESEEVVDA